jgi:hypothetical protein
MSLEQRSALEEIARRYNGVMEAGKLKQKRDMASEVHRLVFQAIKEIEAEQPANPDLLREATSLFLDIRMGRPSTFPA